MEIMENIASNTAQADMTVNAKKSNIMTISLLKSAPLFKQPIPPEMSVQQFKLLGITISSNLKWEVHSTNITKQANLELPMLKLFFKFSCPAFHLLRIYTSLISPVHEYFCPVWHFALTTSQSYSRESVQKQALRIIYGQGKLPYHFLLKHLQLTTLSERRTLLCTRFGNKAMTNPRFQDLFPLPFQPLRSQPLRPNSQKVPTFQPLPPIHTRYWKIFIPAFVNVNNQ